jgi:hypothetical protein
MSWFDHFALRRRRLPYSRASAVMVVADPKINCNVHGELLVSMK